MQQVAKLAAFLASASGAIITGDLPPNSKQTFFKLEFADYFITSLPIKVDPVKLILEILWEDVKADPASCPYPGTILYTPGGNPASLTH